MNNERYETNTPWIGSLPSSWKTIRFKDKYQNIKEVVGVNVDEYERLALTLNGVIKREKTANDGLQPEKFDSYQILKPGDFIFKMIDLQNISTSRVGISNFTGIVSPAYLRFAPKTKEDSGFIYFYLMNLYYNCVFNNLGGNGVRSALTASDMGNLICPYPSEEKRTKISNYLKSKIYEIDSLIKVAEQNIEEFKKYKTSLITTAVTKGVKDTKKVESGIDWIGLMPENWRLIKLGSLFKTRNEKVSDKDYQALSVSKQGIVLQMENVAKTDANDDRKLVLKGDFVINSRSDRKQSSGLSRFDGSVSLINTVIYSDSADIDKDYIHYLLKNYSFAEEFYKYGHGIVADLWTTRWQEMKNIILPIPPIDEQREIVNYLSKKEKIIDEILALKEEKISLLNQYKKAILFEYTTGKKEVD